MLASTARSTAGAEMSSGVGVAWGGGVATDDGVGTVRWSGVQSWLGLCALRCRRGGRGPPVQVRRKRCVLDITTALRLKAWA